MKKLLNLSIVMMLSLIIVGCSKKDAATTDTATAQQFTITSCNQYVNVMTCIIDKSASDIKDQQQKSFDSTINLWKTLTDAQLTQACDASIQAIQQQKEMIEKMGCTVE
jgi:curli biogenesis system outer membrane secretion channel CsgG